MSIDLQKASVWKRVSAFLFDGIMLCTLAVAVALALSALLGYNRHTEELDTQYAKYESAYGVTFNITSSEYEALSAEKQKQYDDAYQALIADEEVLRIYNIVINLSLVILTLSILVSNLLLEFTVPLLFGDGQTLGKKIFGIGLMRTDSVKMNGMQLFVRTILGKFTIETMIPVYLLMMMFMGSIGLLGPIVLLGIGLLQLLSVIFTHNNAAIHDLLAGTVVVDISSQQIFRSSEELIAYTQKRHAEEAARKPY